MQTTRLLDPEAIDKLRRTRFGLHRSARDTRTGIHRSRAHGPSQDFFEHRPYDGSEDPRHIDWRLFGRSDRLYTKRFEEEAGSRWCVMLDRSASMGFGSDGVSKLEYGKRVAATLAYLLVKQGDSVSLGTFGGSGASTPRPRPGMPSLLSAMEGFTVAPAEGRTSLHGPVLHALEAIGTKTAFIMISDFLAEPGDIDRALELLGLAGWPAMLLQILDREEVEFSYRGPLEVQDMETDARVHIDPESCAARYRARLADFREKLERTCRMHAAGCRLSLTTDPVHITLAALAAG